MIGFIIIIFLLLFFFVVLPIGTICGIAQGIKNGRIRKEEAIIRKAKLDQIRMEHYVSKNWVKIYAQKQPD